MNQPKDMGEYMENPLKYAKPPIFRCMYIRKLKGPIANKGEIYKVIFKSFNSMVEKIGGINILFPNKYRNTALVNIKIDPLFFDLLFKDGEINCSVYFYVKEKGGNEKKKKLYVEYEYIFKKSNKNI